MSDGGRGRTEPKRVGFAGETHLGVLTPSRLVAAQVFELDHGVQYIKVEHSRSESVKQTRNGRGESGGERKRERKEERKSGRLTQACNCWCSRC